MAPRRKLSQRQLELLVEFAESNLNLALGRFSGGPLASQAAKKAWESVALQLNAVAEGATKTADQWRRYWIEFKAKAKAKAADTRRSVSGTGGGPNKLIPLTAFENRVLALMGPIAVSSLPGVAIPIHPSLQEEVLEQNTSCQSSTSLDVIETEPAIEIEWLEDPPSDVLMTPSFDMMSDVSPNIAQRQETEQSDILCATTSKDETLRHKTEQQKKIRKKTTTKTFRHDERIPQWAYELERRRITVEKRQAAAIESIASTLLKIQQDISSFLNKK